MIKYLSEFLGTMLLVALGNGVCAAQNLDGSFFKKSGAVYTMLGWGLAVMLPAMAFGSQSGAHFNPAVTIGFAMIHKVEWSYVPGYIIAQLLGGFLGACIVYLVYKDHIALTLQNGAAKEDIRGIFCTSPAIRNYKSNFVSEMVATFMLVFFIVCIPSAAANTGMSSLLVFAIIMSCGFSFGATTGFAMNPARDTMPRLAYKLLIRGDADAAYAWVPIFGPIVGGILGALLGNLVVGWI